MPELPEVETVRRALSDQIVGHKIIDVEIRYNNIIDDDIVEFKNNIIDKKIISLSRLGKYLIINFIDGAIISHLRMEGKYFYLANASAFDKHTHVIFHLSNGYMLLYNDVRKFGRMTYRAKEDIYTTFPLKNVGVDPVLAQNINVDDIYGKIRMRKTPIKTVLLSQEIISGLGNIYVDEVLYSSKINPHRLSNSITKDEVRIIIEESIRILNLAILNKGTTIRSYTSSLNVKGNYQNFLNVHTKSECPHCKSILFRDKINGRTTYYCNNCQR